MNRILVGMMFAAHFASALADASQNAGDVAKHSTDLSAFAWLSGVWQADALGGQVQNMFQPATNGEMLCTLQVAKEGRIVRYELCAIRTQAGHIGFNVVAFGPDMHPAPPVPVRPLVSATATAISFDGISFVRTAPDAMTVTIKIPTPEGAAQRIDIHYTRIASFANASGRM
jgi:hypothetical protein